MKSVCAAISATALAGCGLLADGDLEIDVHVDSITPAAIPTDGASQVTIVGTNFDEGVTVTFDGIPALAVVRGNASVLTVVPPVHAIGAVDVVIANVDGRSLELPRAIRYYAGTVAFTEGTTLIDASLYGQPIFGGDIDGDGIDDAVAYDTDFQLTPWLLDGQGRATRGTSIGDEAGAGLPHALRDIDGDGRADAITGHGVLRARANGTLAPLVRFPGARDDAAEIAVGNFTGGARAEIAVAYVGDGIATVTWLGDAMVVTHHYTDADHQVRSLNPVDTFAWAEQPVSDDFDGDGYVDLAYVAIDDRVRIAHGPDLARVTTLDSVSRVSIYDGPINVSRGMLATVGARLIAVDRSRTLIYTSVPGGGFTATETPALCNAVGTQAALTMVMMPPRNVEPSPILGVRCNQVTRVFAVTGSQLELQLQLGTNQGYPTALVDIDRDGLIDLAEVTARGTLLRYTARSDFDLSQSLLSHGTVKVLASHEHVDPALGVRVITGAFERGGIAAANGNRISILDNPAAPNAVAATTTFGANDRIEDIAACDLDHDGFDDLVVLMLEGSEYHVRTVTVRGDRFVVGSVIASALTSPSHRMIVGRAADNCEVLWLTTSGDNPFFVQSPVESIEFTTDGRLHRSIVIPDRVQLDVVRAIDIDGDDDLDLFTPISWDRTRSLLLRRDRDSFSVETPQLPAAIQPGGNHARDFGLARTADGRLQLWWLIRDQHDQAIARSWLDRDGNQELVATAPLAVPVGGAQLAVELGDVDGDGFVDALLVGAGSSFTLVTQGGFGSQLATVDIANATGEIVSGWSGALVSDVDHDGLADIVFAADSYAGRLGTVLNASH